MWAPVRGGVWAHKAVVIWHTTSHSCTFRRCGALSTSVLVYNCCSSCSRKRGSLGVVNLRAARTTLDLAPDSLQDVRADAFEERFSSASPSGTPTKLDLAPDSLQDVRADAFEERFSSASPSGTPTKLDLAPDSLQDVRADAFEDGGALLVRRHAHELAVLPDAARRSIVACLAFRLLFVEKCTMRTHPLEQIDRVAKRGLVILIMRARCSNRPGGDRIWRGA